MRCIKTYSEMASFSTFIDRFNYLKLGSTVGRETFGYDRYLNQVFYKSSQWKKIRDQVIIRDDGCDLGIQDRPITGRIVIHHINPLIQEDIENTTSYLLNPEYLVCVSFETHNAIHYGDANLLIPDTIPQRTLNDTCPWRK